MTAGVFGEQLEQPGAEPASLHRVSDQKCRFGAR
jgi:hypothetical protein